VGVSVLIAALIPPTNGQRQEATFGIVLGAAMVVGNEWWAWRKRIDG
jgi:hypothetical protein